MLCGFCRGRETVIETNKMYKIQIIEYLIIYWFVYKTVSVLIVQYTHAYQYIIIVITVLPSQLVKT